MLKNIKLFSTDSDRTTYESSASYERPYVSKVTADNSVHYNVLITFTIHSVQYQAEEGMTWGDFINSKYNINNDVYIDNTNIFYGNHAAPISITANINDVIISNRAYGGQHSG